MEDPWAVVVDPRAAERDLVSGGGLVPEPAEKNGILLRQRRDRTIYSGKPPHIRLGFLLGLGFLLVAERLGAAARSSSTAAGGLRGGLRRRGDHAGWCGAASSGRWWRMAHGSASASIRVRRARFVGGHRRAHGDDWWWRGGRLVAAASCVLHRGGPLPCQGPCSLLICSLIQSRCSWLCSGRFLGTCSWFLFVHAVLDLKVNVPGLFVLRLRVDAHG